MLAAARITRCLRQSKKAARLITGGSIRPASSYAQLLARSSGYASENHLSLHRHNFSKLIIQSRAFADNALPAHERVTLPNLSPTMETGTIVSWEKEEGDFVGEGEVLANIETDKATMEMETPEEGYLAKIIKPAGSKDIAINELICIMVADEDDVAAFKDYDGSTPAAPAATTPTATAPPPAAPAAPAAAPVVAAPVPEATEGRIFASPLARRLAAEKGINLASVPGIGPRGRITVEDVESATPAPASPPPPPPPMPVIQPFQAPLPAAPAIPQAPGMTYTDITLTNMRKVIARRLVESKQTVPHYYLSVDVNMDKVMSLRSELNSSKNFKLSLNDFVIKAAALSLKKVPQCNSQWMNEFIREFHNVDISVAVSTDGGLITPIVVDADKKGLLSINQDVAHLAEKARSNKLKPEEFQGGTFTISNLGMYGITNFSAVINPPQSCIMAVGGTTKRIVPDEGLEKGYKSSDVMSVTLSCDHRVVDGAVGAEWLKVFRAYLENPLTMML